MSIDHPPYVIERSSRGERTYDIFSRLLMDRIVFLGTPINDDVANIIIAQLLFLDADNPERDIYLYINSPGGSVSRGHGDLRHDAVPERAGEHDLHGDGGDHGLVPARGGRDRASASALPHARIMIHQPSGGAQGTAADIEIQAREILYLRAKMNELYGQAHRAPGGADRARHGPRSLHVRGRGQGIRASSTR